MELTYYNYKYVIYFNTLPCFYCIFNKIINIIYFS